MSIRERLKLAYENVSYSADKAWGCEFNSLQNTNMDLLLKENELQRPKTVDFRPRTVRECIPNSRLAKYSNYEYNDSRELSYTAGDFSQSPICADAFKDEINKEPWMLKEVDELFKFYTENLCNNVENNNKSMLLTTYESPFLRTNTLPEYLLKMHICKDRVKRLWDVRNTDSNSFIFRSLQSLKEEKSLLVYKSPAGQVFVSECNDVTTETKEDYYEYYKDNFEFRKDMEHLLPKSLQQKKIIPNENQLLDSQPDTAQQRRLYSAVLQGYSQNKIPSQPNENQMTILRRNVNKTERNLMEKLGNISELSKKKTENSFKLPEEDLVRKPLNSDIIPRLFPNSLESKSVQTTLVTNDASVNSTSFTTNRNQNHENCYQNSRLMTNNFFSHMPPVQQPRYRQNYVPTNFQYPSFFMFIQNSFQQQNMQLPFYNPILLQGTVPPNFDRVVPPRTYQVSVIPQYPVPTSNYVAQNLFMPNIQRFNGQQFRTKVKTKPELLQTKILRPSGAVPLTNVKKTKAEASCSSLKTSSEVSIPESGRDFDELVTRTVNMVLEDSKPENIVPVSKSHSDELERQALEQYNSSSDNVYQDLERQAAEEYENCSENYQNPPNCDLLFGGFFKRLIFLSFI